MTHYAMQGVFLGAHVVNGWMIGYLGHMTPNGAIYIYPHNLGEVSGEYLDTTVSAQFSNPERGFSWTGYISDEGPQVVVERDLVPRTGDIVVFDDPKTPYRTGARSSKRKLSMGAAGRLAASIYGLMQAGEINRELAVTEPLSSADGTKIPPVIFVYTSTTIKNIGAGIR